MNLLRSLFLLEIAGRDNQSLFAEMTGRDNWGFLVNIVGRDHKMLARNFQLLSKLWTRSSTDTL